MSLLPSQLPSEPSSKSDPSDSVKSLPIPAQDSHVEELRQSLHHISAVPKRKRRMSILKPLHIDQKGPQDDYYVRQILRQSAFATIMLAHDSKANRPVAIKVTNIQALQKEAVILENPVLEASIMRRIPPHPNIVSLLAEYFTRHNHWLVMEYAPNGDLFDFAENYAPLPAPFVKRVFCDIASALAHMHRVGICHLDVSMENVLLDADLNAKLTDFGVARQMPKGNALFPACHGLKPGKLRYIAPEVLEERPFDGRLVDAFALGVIMFALLTGSAPFHEASPTDKRWALIAQDGVRALLRATDDEISSLVSDDAADLLDHLLVAPEKRWNIGQTLLHRWLRLTSQHD